MHLPCAHFSPLTMTFQSLESIITGTEAISGSAAIMFRNVTISCRAFSSPSSILMSMTRAPSATCLRAMAMAWSYCFSLMSRRNFLEPATLQRSPTLTKCTAGVTSSKSSPLSQSVCGFGAGTWGRLPSTNGKYRAMKSGVVPQQPPIMFTSPSFTISPILGAMLSAVSSYSPMALGSPALGYAEI